MWLFELFFPQFWKSDVSRYGYLEVFQSPLEFEITRVDCSKTALTTYIFCIMIMYKPMTNLKILADYQR